MDPQQLDRKSLPVMKDTAIIYEQPNLPPLDPELENPIPHQNPSIATLNNPSVLRSMLKYSSEPDSELECDAENNAVFQQSDLPPPLDFPAENPVPPQNIYITQEYTAKAMFEDFRKPSKLQSILEFPLTETLAEPQIQNRFATIIPSRLRKRYIHPNAGLVDEPKAVEEVLFMDGLTK